MSGRFAIYWMPPSGSALWELGVRILGRDAATGETLPQVAPPGFDAARFHELTRSSRLYGLHATLKPPFRLASGTTEQALRERLKDFASGLCPFTLPRLALKPVGRFLALTPVAPSAELDLLARDCVERFDHFRAEPSQDELDKRRAGGLTDRQEKLLSQWGYPYVMDQYRFHLTLTDSIAETFERERCRQGLETLLASLAQSELSQVEIREICLFEQPGPGLPFIVSERYPFGPSH